MYTALKFLHVLLAILAVGINASYGIWLARASKEPAHEAHVLRGIKFLDDRVANPAYVLLLVTGLSMVVVSDSVEPTDFWVATALVLFTITALLALLVYTPTLRKQVELAEGGATASSEYQKLSKRSTLVGALLGVLAVSIVFLMVVKPNP